jgi:pentatricopeptide repeat protein
VNTLWQEGKTDEAVSAVQEMERRGIVGSAGLYYDLARCLCSAGRCQEALEQVLFVLLHLTFHIFYLFIYFCVDLLCT